MRSRIFAFLAVMATCPIGVAQTNSALAGGTEIAAAAQHDSLVEEFDQRRDAAADIKAAISEAQRTHRRILLYVGGDWCPYCLQMQDLFRRNPDLLELRDSQFITVPVAYGYGNDKSAALSPYGKVLGIPHFFVLESDGTLLQSQHVVELRENGRYDKEKVKQFLSRWSRAEDDAASRPGK